MQERPVLALPLALTGTVSAYRFVTAAGVHAGAGAAAHGVSQFGGESGDTGTVTVLGSAIVEAGAAISAGAEVQSDSVGRSTTSAGGVVLGRALTAAGAAGVKHEVLLYQQIGAKFGHVLTSNDITNVSVNGALPISGISLIAIGTGLAGLTLAAPQPGCLARIRAVSRSSGSAVVTTAVGVTLDGTNNTATFDAAGEELVLGYASATAWAVIENVGSVALSDV